MNRIKICLGFVGLTFLALLWRCGGDDHKDADASSMEGDDNGGQKPDASVGGSDANGDKRDAVVAGAGGTGGTGGSSGTGGATSGTGGTTGGGGGTTGGSGGTTGGSGGFGQTVAVISFTASTDVVSTGDSVTLTWVTRGAASCEINPGAVPLWPTSSGSVDLAVKADTDFVLTCEGPGGPVSSAPVTVRVNAVIGDSDWANVSAGDDHTCAVKTDGTLFCWGYNLNGRLGNNATKDSHVPVQESTAATDWAQVSAGGSHNCAIKTNGTIFCWGDNDYSQLGNDAITRSLVPIQESTAATDWTQVSVGANGVHNCAIKTDHTLVCWGDNEYGQLGNNSTTNSAVPVQESTAANDWANVFARGFHTCAIKTDGTLFCWGRNQFGQLGNNSTTDSLVPVQVGTAATQWANVSLGAKHTCAIKTDGTLFCWGSNDALQLGNDATTQSSVRIQECTGANDWVQVSSGEQHTCAIKSNGTLLCWGFNDVGQLGNNAIAYSSYVPVQESTAATNWASVSVGGWHTCAIKTNGTLFCWGYNAAGCLGNNSTEESRVPVQVSTTATD